MRFSRLYQKPEKSILLLGPRGIGKSTFIRDEVKPALTIDLLKSVNARALSKNPSELEDMTAHLKPKQTVFIDEIQKIPELLDEVHRLIEEKNLTFILTGSSARRLKKNGVNLLGGRALQRRMFPLSMKELGSYKKVTELLTCGQLPTAVNLEDMPSVNDYLFSYVEAYLKEEVLQEGLVRNLTDFGKFIEMAGQYHGQILNFENIAREVGKSGDTIKSWFQILEDTLVGSYLEAYPLNIFPRESKHPKFYFFDNGVARASEGLRNLELMPEKRGFYLELVILNELKIYREITGADFRIFYYNVNSIGDIDFIIETKRKSLSSASQFMTLEIKHTKKWNSDFQKMSLNIRAKVPLRLQRMLAIYLGDTRLTKNEIDIFPLNSFIKALWDGELV